MKTSLLLMLALLATLVGKSDFLGGRGPARLTREIPNAHSPHLTTDHRGNLVMSWVAQCTNEEPALLRFAVSPDHGRSFNQAVTVPGSTGTDCAQGENPPKIAFKADGTIIAVFQLGQPSEAHPYGGEVYLVSSADGGQTWSPGQQLWQTGDHNLSFFDVETLPDGEVGVLWVEEKNRTGAEGSTPALRFAKTTPDNRLGPSVVVSPTVCQGCKVQLHVDAQKQVHTVFWQVFPDGARDLAHSYSPNYGRTFTAPRPVSPSPVLTDTCPPTGPDLVTIGKTLHVSWLSQGMQATLYTTSSRNNGKRFSPPTPITLADQAAHPALAALPGGLTVFAWDEPVTTGDRPRRRIAVKSVDRAGNSFTCYVDAREDLIRPVLWGVGEKKAFVAYTKVFGDYASLCFETFQAM